MNSTFRLLVLTGLIFSLATCSLQDRSGHASITIAIPKKPTGKALSSSALELGFIAVNIHIPGQPNPRVKTLDVKNGTVSEPLTLNNIPTDNPVLIQLLAVFFDTLSGEKVFAYGDTNKKLLAGANSVSLVATEVGTSGKSGEIGGRYLTGLDTGPTGTLVGSIKPPGNKPAMEVIREEIFNGWFKLFVLDSPDFSFTYTVKETGEVLFGQPVSLPYFQNFHTSSGPQPYYVFMNLPQIHFFDDERPRAPTEYYFGFFPGPGVSAANLTGKQVCKNSNDESIINGYMEANKTTPLGYSDAFLAGGVSKSRAQIHNVAGSGNCPQSKDNLIFRHQRLGAGENEAFGFQGPYRLFNSTSFHKNAYTYTKFDSPSTIELYWKYMPDITSADISGSALYAKLDPNGGGGGGGEEDIPCNIKAQQKGFLHVDDIPISAPGTNLYNFVGNGGSNVNGTNNHSWRFLMCPYKDKPSGERFYFQSHIEDHCRGGCQPLQNFGIGDTDISATGSFSTPAGMDASSGRVTSLVHNPTYTELTLSEGGGSTSGQFAHGTEEFEVLLHITGVDSNGCGNNLAAGKFQFTRALDIVNGGTGTPTIKIPKGTFLDDITATGAPLTTNGSGNFCYVQAVHVPNYKDVTITGNILPLNFDYSLRSGGGIVAFRSSGTLTFNAGTNINNPGGILKHGYIGGDGSNPHGAGDNGDRNNSMQTSTGGAGAGNGGGGGGDGRGASGSSDRQNPDAGLGGGSSNGDLQGFKMFLGGGGGFGSDGGGAGGVAVFIAANRIQLNGPNAIVANGLDGAGGMEGGGGGGGSINLIANEILGPNGSDGLALRAIGGLGQVTSPNTGGGGGGGWIRAEICSDPNSAALVDSNADGFIDATHFDNAMGYGGVELDGSGQLQAHGAQNGNINENGNDGDPDNDGRTFRPSFCN